jgi:hypothetical protein
MAIGRPILVPTLSDEERETLELGATDDRASVGSASAGWRGGRVNRRVARSCG